MCEEIVNSDKFKAVYGDCRKALRKELNQEVQTFVTDPPYNINKDYGEVSDSLPEEEYRELLRETLELAYENSTDDASFFMIHYPQELAKRWDVLTDKWEFHQWINWCYPSNYGQSDEKFTNASRAIVWLKKKESPKFYPDRVVQPYKNPEDNRIKEHIRDGKKGTQLYDWWKINHCKNVSSDYKGYSNQIPEKLLKVMIVSTTDKGDLVADPFSGSFSTSRTALKNGRFAWGSDANNQTKEFAEEVEDDVSFNEAEEPPFFIEEPEYQDKIKNRQKRLNTLM